MRILLPLAACLMLLAACHRRQEPQHVVPPRTTCIVKTTPVKNQGHSDLCWLYAMLATIESEHLMMGDSVNLSADFLARHHLEEQARLRYFTGKALTTRGMASMALRLLQRHGLTHHDAYRVDVNYKVLARKVEKTVDAHRDKGLQAMSRPLTEMLDEHLRPLPRYVFMLGAEYTTGEFARSMCRPGEYMALTSFTHHPYGETFSLEVPDNYGQDEFLNLPLNTLMAHIDKALRTGHPVCWEGDISEPGFTWAKGVARLETSPTANTAEARQRGFEKGQTTDDHCMELIGIARTPRGKKYYIAKNSWGKGNAYGGFMYLSSDYVRMKTIAVWMSREAFGNGL